MRRQRDAGHGAGTWVGTRAERAADARQNPGIVAGSTVGTRIAKASSMITNQSSSPLDDLTASSASRASLSDYAAPRSSTEPAAEEQSELVAATVVVALVALVVWKLALHCMAVWHFIG